MLKNSVEFLPALSKVVSILVPNFGSCIKKQCMRL